MIVTIDGTAGSGKSTAAKGLAKRLGIAYLDTGAMYRALGFEAMRRGVCLDDAKALLAVAVETVLSIECTPERTRVCIAGKDVSDEIRSIHVSRAASSVAVVQPIRDLLVGKQREIGVALGSFVADGRDQGSVVFPDADLKFVVTAPAELRAERRLAELRAANHDVAMADVLADVRDRDARDAVQWQPILDSGEAIVIDTSAMGLDEVVDRLERLVRSRCEAGLETRNQKPGTGDGVISGRCF